MFSYLWWYGDIDPIDPRYDGYGSPDGYGKSARFGIYGDHDVHLYEKEYGVGDDEGYGYIMWDGCDHEGQGINGDTESILGDGVIDQVNYDETIVQEITTMIKSAEEMTGRPVLVTTAHRGVFFGYLENEPERGSDTLILKRCRCALFWPAECKGFLGLAAFGPLNGSRIGPPADVELRNVTSIANVEPEAVERWESAPWSE